MNLKRVELLAPAGNMDCLKAAIEAGCDAVYLGGKQFGARSFSLNFTDTELKEAVQYAHLRNVKVYITVNTLVYESEVSEFLNYIDYLVQIHADAIIVQDIGMLDVVRQIYPDLEIHASTQMHIHTLPGVQLLEQLGVKRVVLARETELSKIIEIKEKTHIELEIFGHGALCMSYSGQCLMSSLIGGRSGNRGSCAQCCRQPYHLETLSGKMIPTTGNYLLSLKDLNTLSHLKELMESGIDSIKLEGRMKRPQYVYWVTRLYRKAIDQYYETGSISLNASDLKELQKLFHRGFTKGFLFQEENSQMVQTNRPNHIGIPIGKVVSTHGNRIRISLEDTLHVQDGIRILGKKDVGFTVTQMFEKGHKIPEAFSGHIIELICEEKVLPASLVLLTTDSRQLIQLEQSYQHESRKIPIIGVLVLRKNMPIQLDFIEGQTRLHVESDFIVENALQTPLTQERIYAQMNRLQETPYFFSEFHIEMDNMVFVPIQKLNAIRREAIMKLNQKRLERPTMVRQHYNRNVSNYPYQPKTAILLQQEIQKQWIFQKQFDQIYLENDLYQEEPNTILKLPRVMNDYPNCKTPLLIGELGSLWMYPNAICDFSFNVVNSYAVAFLHALGAHKITLSYELTVSQIQELVEAYHNRYHANPNLEVIVYSKPEAMICKFDLFQFANTSLKEGYLVDLKGNRYYLKKHDKYVQIYHYQLKTMPIKPLRELQINWIRYQLLEETVPEKLPF